MVRVLLATFALAAPTALAQFYSVAQVDLSPAAESSWATAVTGDGRVTGAASIESGRRTLGFVWRNGAVEQLVVPQAGDFSARPRALDIHHHVAVLGMSDAGSYAGLGCNVNFGFTSQPFFSWIPSPDPYPAQFVAAENLGNAMVLGIAATAPFETAVGAGTVGTGAGVRQGFVSLLSRSDDVGDPPRTTLLTGFGGAQSPAAALAVNAAGDVVGYAADSLGHHRPFLRPASTGAMSDLGTLGGPSGEALAISSNGFIAGRADASPGTPHAFVRAPGASSLSDLGTLGGASSAAFGVNASGVAVGESWTADGLLHAVVWKNGAPIDLNSRIPPASGWVLTHASAINDAGVIVGWGVRAGVTRGFVLTPACYANCDGSTTPPILNVQDFGCFLNAFASSEPYANCDNSTIPPVLNVQDFGCFLNAFAAGCP